MNCTCSILTNCEEGTKLAATLKSAYNAHIANKADKTLEDNCRKAMLAYWHHLENAEKLREECKLDD